MDLQKLNKKNIQSDIKNEFSKIKTEEELFNLEKKYFSRKSGIIGEMFKNLVKLSKEEKKEFGPKINNLKSLIESEIKNKKRKFFSSNEKYDLNLPAKTPSGVGKLNPISIVKKEMIEIFTSMGFHIQEGPEIENNFYNFKGLNFEDNHPAQDLQDIFYVKNSPDFVLRSQTSNMQVRTFEKRKMPVKSAVIGRCFRNETTDATHEHTFHQIEGFAVDENITVENMKYTLNKMFEKILEGKNVEIRFRPSYFPFTEPSYEFDARLSGEKNWVEWGGCGMIHPNVLSMQNIDTEKYRGFAFGFGLERIAMTKFGIKDLRSFYTADLRFLNI